MIDYWETYFCENCNGKTVSNCGNPLYSFGDMEVCKDCLNELEREESEEK